MLNVQSAYYLAMEGHKGQTRNDVENKFVEHGFLKEK